MTRETLGIIFAHEKIDAMRELTANRAAASVPFGGRYRIIDFPLSNMVGSNIKNVGVVTKSDYYSLMDHLGTGKQWDLNRKRGGLSILPPSIGENRTLSDRDGKISSLMGILDYIKNSDCKYVLLTDANVVANIDYRELLRRHIEKQAYMTALYKPEVFEPGKFKSNTFADIGKDGRICDVTINQNIQLHSNMLLGTYIIERGLLEFLICQCVAHNKYDFERNIIQEMSDSLDIFGCEYTGFAERIDSIDSFFKTNLDLLKENVRNELFNEGNEIITKVHDEVPAEFKENSCVKNSLIADGCIINGTVENSIIFRNVKVKKGATIKNCIIMQGSEIGENADLEYCITDRLVTVSQGVRLHGAKSYPSVLPKGCKI